MRRTVLAAVTMAAALLLGTSVALAAAISGTQGNDRLTGTVQADQIYGLNGNDTLQGSAGPDELYGGAGEDREFGQLGNDEVYGGSEIDILFGGDGRDFINSADRGNPDSVNCGGADGDIDVVVADPQDGIAGCNAEDDVRVVR